MEHNQGTIVPRLIINAPYVSNFMTILDFSSVAEKIGRYREVILAVAVAERYK